MHPVVETTSWLIFGSVKLSFGHALLRSLNLMQIFHFPFFLGTTTILIRQVGYLSSLMNCTSRIILTSSKIVLFFSWLHSLLFYLMGLASFMMFSLWQVIWGSIPSMSFKFQVKIVTLHCKHFTRAFLTLVGIFFLIETYFPLTNYTFSMLEASPIRIV